MCNMRASAMGSQGGARSTGAAGLCDFRCAGGGASGWYGTPALRDAVVSYNLEGLAGLNDRPKGHRPRRLDAAQEAALAAATPSGTGFVPGPGPTCAAGWKRIPPGPGTIPA